MGNMTRAGLWWLYLAAGVIGISVYFAMPAGGLEQRLVYDGFGTSAVIAVLAA